MTSCCYINFHLLIIGAAGNTITRFFHLSSIFSSGLFPYPLSCIQIYKPELLTLWLLTLCIPVTQCDAQNAECLIQRMAIYDHPYAALISLLASCTSHQAFKSGIQGLTLSWRNTAPYHTIMWRDEERKPFNFAKEQTNDWWLNMQWLEECAYSKLASLLWLLWRIWRRETTKCVHQLNGYYIGNVACNYTNHFSSLFPTSHANYTVCHSPPPQPSYDLLKTSKKY
jgi:hypothetical protein